MKRNAFAVLPLVLILASVTCSLAQSQMASGDISGTVKDPHGSAMSGVRVRLTRTETGVSRNAASDTSGHWYFIAVQPGEYEVRAEHAGFVIKTISPVPLTVGESVELDLSMEIAETKSEILVQFDSSVLETERTQQSDTVTGRQIDNLPINQRNFLDFALLSSGVSDAGSIAAFSLPQAPTSKLSFLGQSGRSNSITIDGVDNNDDSVAAERSTLSQEAVQEFQINRSNYSAEFGRASGGVINIVTKSGTDDWHGGVFAFVRNQSLDARNAFAFGANGSAADPPFSRLQAGMTLGGPVRSQRSFFFASYEGLRQRESRFVTFLENTTFFQPSASQNEVINELTGSASPSRVVLGNTLKDALTTSSIAGSTNRYPETTKLLLDSSGIFPYSNDSHSVSLRLDHSLNESNQLFGRWTFTNTNILGDSFGGMKAPSRASNYHIRDNAVAVGDTSYIDASHVNEVRFQFANRRYDVTPADPLGPEVTINGFVGLGRGFFLPSLRTENRFQLLDNFTIATGKHVLKVGGDANVIPINTSTEVFMGGRFIFGEAIPLSSVIDSIGGAGTSSGLTASNPALAANIAMPISSLQAFNLGLPLLYQQGFGDPHARLQNSEFSGYVTDHYRVAANLSVDLGLRYDMELQPASIHRDKNNFAPRVAFAFSPMKKTLMRGGYGIYYAPIYEAIAFIGHVLNGTQISQVFLPLSGLPVSGGIATSAQVWNLLRSNGVLGNRAITLADISALGIVPGATPPVMFSADGGIVNPYSQQFSLGIEREASGFNFSAAYLGNRGVKLIRSRNVNLRQTGSNAFGPVFSRINPLILQDNRVESSASSIYHGMNLNLSKRFGRYYQLQASYSLSKAIDDSTDFNSDLQPANQLNLRGERSLSTFDQRQRFVFSGVFQSPIERGMPLAGLFSGFMVAPVLTLSSGHPFNLLLGFDANGDTQANTDRPANAGRNTGRGPGFASLNLRLARDYHFSGDRFRIVGSIDAFNLFNRVNYSGVNNIVGSSTLASSSVAGNAALPPSVPLAFTSASDPRQIQLGIKLKF